MSPNCDIVDLRTALEFLASIPGQPVSTLESAGEFSPSISADGISCKTIFDSTVPYRLKDRFRRAEFVSVDLSNHL